MINTIHRNCFKSSSDVGLVSIHKGSVRRRRYVRGHSGLESARVFVVAGVVDAVYGQRPTRGRQYHLYRRSSKSCFVCVITARAGPSYSVLDFRGSTEDKQNISVDRCISHRKRRMPMCMCPCPPFDHHVFSKMVAILSKECKARGYRCNDVNTTAHYPAALTCSLKAELGPTISIHQYHYADENRYGNKSKTWSLTDGYDKGRKISQLF
ncbi:hypothetical protein EVAR_103923_1 [Eumeta japonica]|uniref:Uncharacterized protein n=1 Tax=Eumeta variegata TaxID=151549 RepID=A0A4C1T200_EUMVA|nr:hypothetical protein EVAR_103923_1 [Eumeta japonica]